MSSGGTDSRIELNLSDRDLASLPNEYSPTLEVLTAPGNKIAAIPPALFSTCSMLRELHLDHNAINAIPRSIACLCNLRVLSLHDNQITALPDEMGDLSRLVELRLDRNELTHLPDAMCNCQSLQLLHIDGNPIAPLPASIGRLTALRDLGIGTCPRLTQFPPSLGKLTNVSIWVYSPSAIRGIPHSILYDPSAGVISGYVCEVGSAPPVHIAAASTPAWGCTGAAHQASHAMALSSE